MATIPVHSEPVEQVEESDFVAARLPGWTVEVLLRESKENEAAEELDRLVMEGVNSGPGIPINEAFWEDIRAKARSGWKRPTR